MPSPSTASVEEPSFQTHPRSARLPRSKEAQFGGADKQGGRNSQADGFGGFQIDDELKLGRLLYREIGRAQMLLLRNQSGGDDNGNGGV
jgi:hypothetical protein